MTSFTSPLTFALATVLIVLMVGPDQILSRRHPPNNLPSNQCSSLGGWDCRCGRRINVTVKAINQFVAPYFDIETTVTRFPQRPLLFFLEQAANQDGRFNFSASYHGNLGYLINTINKVTANVSATTYWQITSVTNGNLSLECGASTYIPKPNEAILFNFTTWSLHP